MWRALFLAVGITSVILGMECLAIDKAELKPTQDGGTSAFMQRVNPSLREIKPQEWAPWSLISAGAVVILYSFTLPQKMKG